MKESFVKTDFELVPEPSDARTPSRGFNGETAILKRTNSLRRIIICGATAFPAIEGNLYKI